MARFGLVSADRAGSLVDEEVPGWPHTPRGNLPPVRLSRHPRYESVCHGVLAFVSPRQHLRRRPSLPITPSTKHTGPWELSVSSPNIQ